MIFFSLRGHVLESSLVLWSYTELIFRANNYSTPGLQLQTGRFFTPDIKEPLTK